MSIHHFLFVVRVVTLTGRVAFRTMLFLSSTILITAGIILISSLVVLNFFPLRRNKLKEDVRHFFKSFRVYHVFSLLVCLLHAAVGFLRNEIAYRLKNFNHTTTKKRGAARGRRPSTNMETSSTRPSLRRHSSVSSIETKQKILQDFKCYMVESGIYEDWKKGFLNVWVLINTAILFHVHKILYRSCESKDFRKGTDLNTDGEHLDQFKEAHRMLKYVSVVYGHDLSSSVEAFCDERNGTIDLLTTSLGKAKNHRRHTLLLSDLTGASSEHILVRNWEYGGSIKYLNHTVVVDHVNRQIVFAIRGTFTVTDALADLECYSVPFCGGVAHAGFAKMALATWHKATTSSSYGDFSSMEPDYEMIITGHSLGASVATLMTIKILHDKLVSRPVRCIVFGAPATFSPLSAIPDIAPHITTFYHEDDFGAFISLHRIRIFHNSIVAVDRERRALNAWEHLKIVFGYMRPSQRMLDEVAKVPETTQPIEGAPPLSVPGSVMWIRSAEDDSRRVTMFDSAAHMDNTTILLSPTMLLDHHVSVVEGDLRRLTGTNKPRRSLVAKVRNSICLTTKESAATILRQFSSLSCE